MKYAHALVLALAACAFLGLSLIAGQATHGALVARELSALPTGLLCVLCACAGLHLAGSVFQIITENTNQ